MVLANSPNIGSVRVLGKQHPTSLWKPGGWMYNVLASKKY
jgi:hypothetical protein